MGQVDFHRKPHSISWLLHYFTGPKPEGVYVYGMDQDPNARWLAQQKLSLVARWLAGQPENRSLPRHAVKAVQDQER